MRRDELLAELCLPVHQNSMIQHYPVSLTGMALISPAWRANMSLTTKTRCGLSSEGWGGYLSALNLIAEVQRDTEQSKIGCLKVDMQTDLSCICGQAAHTHTNSLLHCNPLFAFAYLDYFSHPLDLFGIFNIWTSGCPIQKK